MSTSKVGALIDTTPTTVARWCAAHLGFGALLRGQHKIPRIHVERMLASESVALIGADPSRINIDDVPVASADLSEARLLDDASNAPQALDNEAHDIFRQQLAAARCSSSAR